VLLKINPVRMSVPRVASTSLPLALEMLVLPVAQRLWMQFLQTKIRIDSFQISATNTRIHAGRSGYMTE